MGTSPSPSLKMTRHSLLPRPILLCLDSQNHTGTHLLILILLAYLAHLQRKFSIYPSLMQEALNTDCDSTESSNHNNSQPTFTRVVVTASTTEPRPRPPTGSAPPLFGLSARLLSCALPPALLLTFNSLPNLSSLFSYVGWCINDTASSLHPKVVCATKLLVFLIQTSQVPTYSSASPLAHRSRKRSS